MLYIQSMYKVFTSTLSAREILLTHKFRNVMAWTQTNFIYMYADLFLQQAMPISGYVWCRIKVVLLLFHFMIILFLGFFAVYFSLQINILFLFG